MKKSILYTSLAVFSVGSAFAQSAVTKAVGYHTESLVTGFNLIGVNVSQEGVAAAGDFDSAGTSQDTDVDFTALLTNGAPYTVQLISGANVGVHAAVNQGWTADTITTTPDISGSIAAGDKYEIIRDWTIADLFGAANESGLTEGTETTADVVWVPLEGGGYTQIYRSVGQGGGFPAINDGWRYVGGLGGNFDADAAGVVIPFTAGIFVQRRGAAMDMVFTGHVRGDDDNDGHGATQTVIGVITGFNAVNRILPVEQTLAELNMASYLGGGTEATADVLWLPIPGGYTQVYNSLGQGGGFPAINDGLRYVGGLGGNFDADASGENFPSGALVQRRGAPGTINLEIPNTLDL